MNKKKILDKISELQKAILWLENETNDWLKYEINPIGKNPNDKKTSIFYFEHLGPIYRMITSLKKEIK